MTWWGLFKSYLKQLFQMLIFRLLPVGLILFGAWYGFLRLVNKPPLDATPVLIMIGGSILLLTLAFFPKILERVKTIKLKDFEIELEEAVAKSAPERYLSIEASGENPIFSEKGDLKHLKTIWKKAIQEPDRPVLLLVNLGGVNKISIVMLFKYLFFLDVISMKTIVLFISSPEEFASLTDVSQNSLIGVISGKRVLHTLSRRFPRLLKIFKGAGQGEFFNGELDFVPSDDSLRSLYLSLLAELTLNYPEQSEFLTTSSVRTWFMDDLSAITIADSFIPSNITAIRKALSKGDEFLLALDDVHLKSIVISCQLTNRISQRVLADLEQSL
ncbi:MAG TPA: hypothetical protein VGQ41_26355 [Pyrinomonadaceae bacterium]|jgi:hypothetical protein|nr:hypothetical protein [Pyrinomonadaceae bacterium]